MRGIIHPFTGALHEQAGNGERVQEVGLQIHVTRGGDVRCAVEIPREERLRFGDGPVATLVPEELGAATGATAMPTVVRSVAALETTARTLIVAR